MDYSKILKELNEASLFDLYRLKVVINQQLENPQRLSKIKKCLKPGQTISYFDEKEKRLIEAHVLKIMRTRLLVQNIHDQEKWEIPLFYVNLDEVNTDIIDQSQEGLNKSQLKVGDMVGFQDKQNNDVNGKIIRLNQKTATIITNTNTEWRVAYEYLHLIYDIEQGEPYLIENRPFEKKLPSDKQLANNAINLTVNRRPLSRPSIDVRLLRALCAHSTKRIERNSQ